MSVRESGGREEGKERERNRERERRLGRAGNVYIYFSWVTKKKIIGFLIG